MIFPTPRHIPLSSPLFLSKGSNKQLPTTVADGSSRPHLIAADINVVVTTAQNSESIVTAIPYTDLSSTSVLVLLRDTDSDTSSRGIAIAFFISFILTGRLLLSPAVKPTSMPALDFIRIAI